MATLDKYLGALRDLKLKHAVEVVTQPAEVTEKNYAYAVGFQGGLKKAEELLIQVLNEEKAE